MNAFVGTALAAVFVCFGCATKSLPPGTPPPEYEMRQPESWDPPDAGTDAPPAPPEPEPPPPAEPLPSDSDAGVAVPDGGS